MGRDALRLAASLLELKFDDIVVLPAYLCREVSKPFVNRCRVVYYDVQSDLSVDPSVIRSLIETVSPKLVVLINYFGFLQPHRERVREVCSARGVPLLEDCAHSLLTKGSGEVGDLCVFSFRKMLPVPDGGGLKARAGFITRTPRLASQTSANVLSVLGALKSLLAARSEFLSRSGLTARTRRLSNGTSPVFEREERVLPMSVFARNGVANASTSDIIERRRADYLWWEERLRNHVRCRAVFPKLEEGVCPLGFPVLIRNREEVRSSLKKVRILLKVEWHLSSEIPAQHTTSHGLAKQMASLPVYPDVRVGERETIMEALDA